MERLTYTVAETAEILGVSLSTVERAVLRGELTKIYIGRRVLIEAEEIKALLKGSAARSEAEAA